MGCGKGEPGLLTLADTDLCNRKGAGPVVAGVGAEGQHPAELSRRAAGLALLPVRRVHGPVQDSCKREVGPPGLVGAAIEAILDLCDLKVDDS